MTKEDLLIELKKGSESWNKLIYSNWGLRPDFSGVKFSNIDLSNFHLSYINFENAVFENVDLVNTGFMYCNLNKVKFLDCKGRQTLFSQADINNALFHKCTFGSTIAAFTKFHSTEIVDSQFFYSNFIQAEFNFATIRNSTLDFSTFAKTDLSDSKIIECNIYGINAWGIIGTPYQKDLLINDGKGVSISIDNLKIAQFLYLMIENQELRNIIDTISSKVVLILGRFYSERKIVLDAIKAKLKSKGFVPVIFDFENASSRDLTETIKILGALSKFIVADITDAKSIPQELSHIIPFHPSIPVIPIIQKDQREYAMMEHFYKYPWVLELYEYETKEEIIKNIETEIITKCEMKIVQLKE